MDGKGKPSTELGTQCPKLQKPKEGVWGVGGPEDDKGEVTNWRTKKLGLLSKYFHSFSSLDSPDKGGHPASMLPISGRKRPRLRRAP
jgi:hypothetical protein